MAVGAAGDWAGSRLPLRHGSRPVHFRRSGNSMAMVVSIQSYELHIMDLHSLGSRTGTKRLKGWNKRLGKIKRPGNSWGCRWPQQKTVCSGHESRMILDVTSQKKRSRGTN